MEELAVLASELREHLEDFIANPTVGYHLLREMIAEYHDISLARTWEKEYWITKRGTPLPKDTLKGDDHG